MFRKAFESLLSESLFWADVCVSKINVSEKLVSSFVDSWHHLNYHNFLYAVFKVHKNVSTWKTILCDKLACLSIIAFSCIGISCHDRENLFSRFTFFHSGPSNWMEITRFELVTSCLQGRRSPNWAIPPNGYFFIVYFKSGLKWTRTTDLTLIRRAL